MKFLNLRKSRKSYVKDAQTQGRNGATPHHLVKNFTSFAVVSQTGVLNKGQDRCLRWTRYELQDLVPLQSQACEGFKHCSSQIKGTTAQVCTDLSKFCNVLTALQLPSPHSGIGYVSGIQCHTLFAFYSIASVSLIVILSNVPSCLLSVSQKMSFFFHLSTYWQVPSNVKKCRSLANKNWVLHEYLYTTQENRKPF